MRALRPGAGGMWQSWQTMPALPCGPSFHSSWVDSTKTPHGSCSLWQVPQNSALRRNGFETVRWQGLSAPARLPCLVLPGAEIQL